MLKRVDGLEAKLREKNDEAVSPTVLSNSGEETTDTLFGDDEATEPAAKRIASGRTSPASVGTAAYSPRTPINRQVVLRSAPCAATFLTGSSEFIPSPAQARVLLDTYFTCFHGKPFCILDEASIRQRFQVNQLPSYLCLAISAVAVRYVFIRFLLSGSRLMRSRHKQSPEASQAATFLSDEYADLSRSEIDVFAPSIDALQALLLLINAYLASGKSKKAYMLMSRNPRVPVCSKANE